MYDNIFRLIENSQQATYRTDDIQSDDNTCKLSTIPQVSDVRASTPETIAQLHAAIGTSPILPETGNTAHNVTRILNTERNELPVSLTHDSTVSTAHLLSFRHGMLNQQNVVDFKGDDNGCMLCDVSGTDMSISSERSHSPSGSVNNSSSSSSNSLISSQPSYTPSCEANISSESSYTSSSLSPRFESKTTSAESSNSDEDKSEKSDNSNPKKGTRTNYTNEQIQALLKIFHETPYPDSEMMETIGKDLGIPEKKVKIWFQNKRARWRRRVNDLTNNNTNMHPFIPAPPMMSPGTPFIYMQNMMTSSPNYRLNDYYRCMQGSLNRNNSMPFTSQFSTYQIPTTYMPTNQRASFQNIPSSMTSFVPAMSSATYSRTVSPLRTTSDQAIRPTYFTNNGVSSNVC